MSILKGTHIEWAMSIRTLSTTEQALLIRLAYYADTHSRCCPSVERLVKETKLSRSTVYRHLVTLEERGIISSQGTAKTNVYTLHRRPVHQSHAETESKVSPMVTPKPEASSSTNGRAKSYFHPTDERPFRQKKPASVQPQPKPKAKRSSSTRSARDGAIPVVTAERAQPTQEAVAQAQGEHLIARGVDPSVARPEGVQRISWSDFRSLKKALNVRKEKPLPAPGIDDAVPAPKPRRSLTDEPSYGNAGQLQEDVEKKPKRTKKSRHWQITPTEDWSCNDLTDHARDLAWEKNPLLVDQIPRGWALGDFNRWLKGGASPALLREMTEDFYGDEINFRVTTDRTLLWSRLRRAITNELADAVDRQPRTPQPSVPQPTPAVAVDWTARDFTGHPLEKELTAMAAKAREEAMR